MEQPVWKDLQAQTSNGEEAHTIGDVHSPKEKGRGTATTNANAAESKWQAEKYYSGAEELQSHSGERTGEQVTIPGL